MPNSTLPRPLPRPPKKRARYGFHGLENFPFDLLRGKSCLIVTHHDFFNDGGVALIR